MKIIHFHIHYLTKPGERVIIRTRRITKQSILEQTLYCQSYDQAHWTGSLDMDDKAILYYIYGIESGDRTVFETGDDRLLRPREDMKHHFLRDFWRPRQDPKQIFFSSAFTRVIFRRRADQKVPDSPFTSLQKLTNGITIRLFAPDVDPRYVIGVTGSLPELGNWINPIILEDKDYPLWERTIRVQQQHVRFEYKYVIYDNEEGEIVHWETGSNRAYAFQYPTPQYNDLVITDAGFRYQTPWWRGAGLAIPVFSQRSADGFGIGEFTDLKDVVDFAHASGLCMVQVLPVNDTIATKTWRDSYPYAAISVFALHPLYINIPAIAPFEKARDQKAYEKDKARLNALEEVDFEAVLELKFKYFRILFEQEKKDLQKHAGFREFVGKNARWLRPYAAYCTLRDLFKTPDFSKWEEFSTYAYDRILAFTSEGSDHYDKVLFYYFMQYHADKQLFEARQYGRKHGVVLKGDLPIGIYRYSCDAWVAPELYNMDEQAGAPPDDYAELGQNWGFPTYNWDEMAKNNFTWWRRRMQKLSAYFDALRIDHILGFFRIWQIPVDQVGGTMGLFNPRLPYSTEELQGFGIRGSLDRFTEPYIRDTYLHTLFGADTGFVQAEFLDTIGEGAYRLKPFLNTQAKIKRFMSIPEMADKQHILKSLYHLVSEVLLIEEPGSEGRFFNPRITLQKTWSYKALNNYDRQALDNLYVDYFYRRHEAFWKAQALRKLPALIDATNMLICGEDLGMIPAVVPEVMAELNILSLEIQRMPKGESRFGLPSAYPYDAVCSPSCHDMSTIRGWWASDAEMAQTFYNTQLHLPGHAPEWITPEIAERIIRQHLASPAILAIFPLQDLLAMHATLQREDIEAEQINDPSNPDQYWRYRFHLNMEALNQAGGFLLRIREMVEQSGRG